MLSAIVGINWGDEGKGRMVDLLGADYDVVVRYQGGNNAGHTVINDKGKFILNLLPSGILREDTVNVMGVGMVVDIEHLCGEIRALESKGIRITPDNLMISDKAAVCMPYHVDLDVLEEERLGDRKQGSTKRGIAPAYSDKYMHKSIRMGDLLFPGTLGDKLANILEWKNLMIAGGYGQEPFEVRNGETAGWLRRFGEPLIPFIRDTGRYLSEAAAAGKNILFEAQLGALRDIDYGIHPYTTSSQTLASYAGTGAGIPGARLDRVIGVIKAYSSSVGGGPFVTEMEGAEAEALREAGGEYGAATGRPRRVGAFDIPASRYGVKTQGADCLALTKLDVLAYMDKIPICVAYEVNGERTERFVTGDELEAAKPIYEYAEGFKQDISQCRRKSDLPKAAADYIRRLEEAVGCAIRYVSVGPKREDYIDMSR
ncbi:MAG: adenylosuccinate synthase [Peptococcaceae bacterium]|jgi:adenylosuccinate synthase|nr:adenylosuccinate synthase [Peptococcaceae bacterium]